MIVFEDMRTAIIHRAPQIESRVAATMGRQTAVVHRAREDELEARSEAPVGRWTKVIAFTVGLAIAIGGYALLNVRVDTRPAAAIPTSSPAASPSPVVEAAQPAAPASASEVVPKAKPHKASRGKHRHAAKHRKSSRR